jgi:hypothetical protein
VQQDKALFIDLDQRSEVGVRFGSFGDIIERI